jgi:tRNA-2-methylthio-N6-dimethylallyladenosine synthase
MVDNVPEEEKERRWRVLNDQHERISGIINRRYQDQTVEVLVEDKHKGKWRGRTRTNKLVFFEEELANRHGQLAQVKIDKTGPWSMSGQLTMTNEK